ncbi:hypothetical protein TKK_0008636 [Trichogramma kaykai]
MSKFAMFCTVIASLNGIILLCLVSSASAYRSLSFERSIGENYLVFGESAVENTTIHYGVVRRDGKQTQAELILRRAQTSFSADSPKEDECKIMLRCESGGFVDLSSIKIEPFGKNRAIVHWSEYTEERKEDTYAASLGLQVWYPSTKYHLRLSIADFSTCKVKTTKLSEGSSRPVKENLMHWNYPGGFFEEVNNPLRYFKGENDINVLSFDDEMSVNKLSIDAEGVASKDEPWLTYPTYLSHPTVIFPLWKNKGYLLIESSTTKGLKRPSMTVAHIQPNGQRQNLTYIEDVNEPMISLANELIGICFREKETTMICTQFKLGDKEIQWFLANIAVEKLLFKRAIYNLPRGEGFLTHVVHYVGDSSKKYLVKIGLDGKAKQFLDPNMKCEMDQDIAFHKIFEDDQGNYCLSTGCGKASYGKVDYMGGPLPDPIYVKFESKCFEPEDFKNISK